MKLTAKTKIPLLLLVLPFVFSGCAHMAVPNQDEKLRKGLSDIGVRSITAFIDQVGCYVDGKAQDGSTGPCQDLKPLPKVLSLGVSAADVMCGEYFRQIGLGQQGLGFYRKQTALTGGIASGMLGLANQSPKFIANVGALFGFATSTFDNYEDSFYFAPTIARVQELVQSKQNNYYQQLSNSPQDIDDVIHQVRTYADLCSAHQIRRFVNDAVQAGTIEKVTDSAAEQRFTFQFDATKNGVRDSLSMSEISDAQFLALYAKFKAVDLIKDGDGNAWMKEQFKTISEKNKEIFDDKMEFKSPDVANNLKGIFNNVVKLQPDLSGRLPTMLNSEISTFSAKKKIEKKAGESPAAESVKKPGEAKLKSMLQRALNRPIRPGVIVADK